jgi:acetoacetyl-CoA synthetase
MSTTVVDARSTGSGEPDPFFTPTAATISASQLTAFIQFCEQETGRVIADSDALYRLSVNDVQLFWHLFLRFSKLVWEGDASPVCTDDGVETARFFPGLRLSYPENLLAGDSPAAMQRPAVTARGVSGVTETLTRVELRQRVLRFAGALRALGVCPGDRVVSVLRNDAGSVVAALGSAAVGATFSSAAPDMGVASLLSRFGQLDPVVLIVSSTDGPGFETQRLRELALGLPTLRSILVLDAGPIPTGFPVPVNRSSDLPQEQDDLDEWTRFPFNHPLYILFSSGTTGMPKCIVHGAGGTLLEHAKEHVLHGDLRVGDKLFFHTSAAWMMWNWQLSALACGVEIVLYDGPVVDPEALWAIVADEHVTAFGTSPAYLRMCQAAGYSPKRELDISSLRSIMSTGAIIYDDQFDWVRDNVGALPVQSISGGTDIVGCFVLGNPNLPVYAGEAQCRSFGLDVRALVPANAPAGSTVGELVCAKPFPSRPLGLHGDSSGERFHAAYFSQNPGVWTHGDVIEITPRGTARMHGRSDDTMNVRGIRVGPAEIYSVLGAFAEIRDSIVVEQPTPGGGGDSRMVLLVVMNDGHQLDPPLRARIRIALARQASPAHIPAVIVDVPELPLTHSGKRSETSVRRALKGDPPTNLDALRNPDCLSVITARLARFDAEVPQRAAATPAGTLEEELTAIWEGVLGVSPIGPDDDFFESGGTSLLTAPLFQQVADRLGRRLPLSTILHAPTIASLAALLRDRPDDAWGSLELLKLGNTKRPLFIAPGRSGEVLGLRPLADHIETDRAIYGLRARGLLDGELPLDRVEDMADAHIDAVRALQPHGPYSLIGSSLGGPVMLEIARRLTSAGEQVEFLGFVSTTSEWARLNRRERLLQAVRLPLRWPRALTAELGPTVRRLKRRLDRHRSTLVAGDPQTIRVREAGNRAWVGYRTQSYDGRAAFFVPSRIGLLQPDPAVVWRRTVTGGTTVRVVAGSKDQLLREPHVVGLARAISESLPDNSR